MNKSSYQNYKRPVYRYESTGFTAERWYRLHGIAHRLKLQAPGQRRSSTTIPQARLLGSRQMEVNGGIREIGVTSVDGGKTWKPWFDIFFRLDKE